MSLFLLLCFLFPQTDQQRVTLHEAAQYDSSNGTMFVAPESLSGWADGSLVISDRLQYTITRLNGSGKLLTQAGSRGTGPGQFRSPGSLDCFQDRIAVADFASTRVQVFSRNLAHRLTFQSSGAVIDLRYDPHGTLWISAHTSEGKRLLKYDTEGNLRATLTPHSLSGKPFYDVFLCAAGSQGEVFLAYLVQNVIEVWDTSGTFLRQFSIPGLPHRPPERTMNRGTIPRHIRVPKGTLIRSISTDQRGNLFVLGADYSKHPGRDVYVFTAQGDPLAMCTLPSPASHIWVSPSGHLVCIQTQTAELSRYRVTYN